MKKLALILMSALLSISVLPVSATNFSDGDVDGDSTVTAHDALYAMQYLQGMWSADSDNRLNALDANNDYVIDDIDIQYILNLSIQ